MKNYASVYKNSKKVVNEAKAIDIDKEHGMILEAVKKEYGIHSFSELSEAERTEYKNIILDFWTPTDGLTQAGIDFINESLSLDKFNNETSDATIKRFFQKEVKADATNYIYGILSGNTNGQNANQLTSEIEKAIGRKYAPKIWKEWIYEVLSKHLQAKIKTYKF